ncbi:MAG: hypothetical protein ACYSUQ_12390 [Planctomycetota bacterium]|jgi:membrane protein YqaA with SNARE-associated domain
MRLWFIAFVGWMALLAAVALLPLPTPWIVMLLASNQMAVIEPVGLRVLVVAAACALASAIANLNEYYLITFLLRYPRIGRLRESTLYRWASRWFSASPFVAVALFGFLPLPVDVVRWLAIVHRYSRARYFAAYLVGRFPRYVIWALSAVWLNLNWRQILILQAVLVLAPALKLAHSIRQKRRSRRAETAELAPADQMP